MAIVRKNKTDKVLHWINARPGRVIALSFLGVILIGTVLLVLPVASQNRQSIGLLQALFTATSATCVTGLVTVDTATYWSVFGKTVILLLIQIGGLGLVTITSFFYTFMRRKASLKAMVATQESTANFGFADVMHLVRKIVLITLVVELIGGFLLTLRFAQTLSWPRALGKGFFLAVSAFCNAGFDLTGDMPAGPFSSLTGMNSDPVILGVIGFLIIVGGLGFVVWTDLLQFFRKRKLNFHSKVVLSLTAILLTVGTIGFFLAEYQNTGGQQSLGGLSGWQRPANAFFQSITARTAGFNSIDQASLTDSSKLMTAILMFIGAAPGSTAGGIKVTTFAVIVATIISDIRQRENIILFRHRLLRETFTRAFAIMGLAMGIVIVVSLLLSAVERAGLEAGHFSFLDLLFETISAFGTVGLSTVGTPQLSRISWSILIPVMYLGRIGPASFAISLAMKRTLQREPLHPEGRTLVG